MHVKLAFIGPVIVACALALGVPPSIAMTGEGCHPGSEAILTKVKGESYEVLEHFGSQTKVLDRGEVRSKSLTLTGSTLRWTDRNGRRRTATLA